MTPETKDKWIAALESGKYKQTEGTLKDEDGYCCLGVLASICGAEPDNEGLIPGDPGDDYYRDSEGLLPVTFADNLGISHNWMEYFAGLNDGGQDFLAIAAELKKIHPNRLTETIIL